MNTYGKFRASFVARTLTIVDMNQTQFQSFSESPRMIGTQGLRGCFVVLIASKNGAILAHIGPTNIASVMSQAATLYSNKKQTHFQDKDVWVVTATLLDTSSTALQTAKGVIIGKLAEMGLDAPRDASYSFHIGSNGDSPEFPDKGTVVVGWVDGRVSAWVENRMLRAW